MPSTGGALEAARFPEVSYRKRGAPRRGRRAENWGDGDARLRRELKRDWKSRLALWRPQAASSPSPTATALSSSGANRLLRDTHGNPPGLLEPPQPPDRPTTAMNPTHRPRSPAGSRGQRRPGAPGPGTATWPRLCPPRERRHSRAQLSRDNLLAAWKTWPLPSPLLLHAIGSKECGPRT